MASDLIASVEQLVAAREARGISAEDMQRQLKIHINQLQALERGAWDALPGLSFVRGVLRGYGRALGVDVEPLLASVGGQNMATDLKPAAPLQEPIRSDGMLGFGNGGGGASWAWLGLMAAGVAALALFFGKGGDSSDSNASISGSNKPVAPARVEESTVTAGSELAIGHAVELTVNKDAGLAEQLVVKFSPDPAKSAINSPLEIKVTFLADSWVEITQADGRTLLQGAQKVASVSEVLARGAVTVTTAYPAKIKLEYDAKPVLLELPNGVTSSKLRLP